MYYFYKFLSVILGSFLVGVGVNLFLVPNKLMDGGMIGLGLLAKYYFQFSPGLITLLFSIPIFGVVFFYNRPLFFNSFHGMVLTSFSIDLLSPLRQLYTFSVPVSAVTGGALIGTGIGVMLAYNTNTGGTDLLAQFAAQRTGIPVALLILLIDGLIIGASIEAIGMYRTCFSFVTILTVGLTTHYFSQIKINEQRS